MDRRKTETASTRPFSDRRNCRICPGGVLKVPEIQTITGGTGRFAGAQGSFTVELYHKLAPSSLSDGVETHDIFGSSTGQLPLLVQLIEILQAR